MAHGTSAPEQVPRGPLMAVCALVLVSLASVAAVRLSGTSIQEPDASTVAKRSLRFEDRPDGSIAVLDARSGIVLESVQGESGFIRGTLRALARERRKHGLGNEPPFELLGRADGRLTLSDPATGMRIDLESFGPTNAGAFARLMNAQPAPVTGR